MASGWRWPSARLACLIVPGAGLLTIPTAPPAEAATISDPAQAHLAQRFTSSPEPVAAPPSAAASPSAASANPADSKPAVHVGVPDATARKGSASRSESDLVKSSQSPLSSDVVVQFGNHHSPDYGLYSRDLDTFSLQALVPFEINPRSSLIVRAVTPFVSRPAATSPALCASSTYGCRNTVGIGDMSPEIYCTEMPRPGGVTWGEGVEFRFPTGATGVTSGKYGAGPVIIAVMTARSVVAEIQFSQLWSYAGDRARRPISTFVAEPSVDYNLDHGYSIIFGSSGISAKWAEPQKWTVPLGGGVSKAFASAAQEMQISLEYYANVVRPTTAARGNVRLTFKLLYPIERNRSPMASR